METATLNTDTLKDGTTTKAAATQQNEKNIGDSTMRLIFADDDSDDYELFKDVVQSVKKSVNITRAYDGIHLLDILEASGTNLPDLIFLDLNMPCKNGFECLEDIKKSSAWNTIPIVIYSTSVYAEQIETTYKKGANLYIQKSASYGEIKTMINKLFAYPHAALSQPNRDKFLFKI